MWSMSSWKGKSKLWMNRQDVFWTEKENVKVEAATQTYATITLQNYFRMYHKLAGMTGTAETEAAEFWKIYKLDVVVIPTNKPITRKDSKDLVYKTKREKYNAVITEIENLVKA